MSKFKPKTQEMQNLMKIKIKVMDIAMENLIVRASDQHPSQTPEEMSKLNALMLKGKALQDEIQKKILQESN